VAAVTVSRAGETFLATHYRLGIEFLGIGVWGLPGGSYWLLLVPRGLLRGVGSGGFFGNGGFLGRGSWFGSVCWGNRACVG
jgi:hypothetical protein